MIIQVILFFVYINNTIKTTFDLNFYFIPSFQTAWIHINMENKEKLSINSFSCILVNLLFEKKLVRNRNLNFKNRLHYIDANTDQLIMLITCIIYENCFTIE